MGVGFKERGKSTALGGAMVDTLLLILSVSVIAIPAIPLVGHYAIEQICYVNQGFEYDPQEMDASNRIVNHREYWDDYGCLIRLGNIPDHGEKYDFTIQGEG